MSKKEEIKNPEMTREELSEKLEKLSQEYMLLQQENEILKAGLLRLTLKQEGVIQ